jgi:hypothetical protein
MMAAIAILFASVLGSISVNRDDVADQYYYPIEKGAKRFLRPGLNEAKDSIEEVTGVSRNQDGIVVTVSHTRTIDWDQVFKRKPKPGSEDIETISEPEVKLLLKRDGLYHIASYERDSVTKKFGWKDHSDNPGCLLKLPVKPGETWSEENKKNRYRIVRTIDRLEKIKVAAGEYEAVVVVVEATQDGEVVPKRTYWFVKGIGVVKAMLGDKVTLELTEYRSATKR